MLSPAIDRVGPYVPETFLLTSAIWTHLDHDLTSPWRRTVEDELIWCGRGSVVVSTTSQRWHLTAGTGVWVDGDEPRSSCFGAGSWGGMTFITPSTDRSTAEPVRRVSVPSAVQEMLRYNREQEMDAQVRRRAQRLCLDLVAPDDRPGVPIPEDPRLQGLCRAILSDPSRSITLAQWSARTATASAATLDRAFRSSTGMSYAAWCRIVRMQAAQGLLAGGLSVQQTARRVGYASPSAFVAAFRRATGRTPGNAFH